MPGNKLLKVTCHLQGSRINSYIKMPSSVFGYLKRELETNLFTIRQLPSFDMLLYWIDSEGDEIGIFDQNDYEIFIEKFSNRDMHMHIAMLNEKISKGTDAAVTANNSETQTKPDDPSFFVIHDNVSCDFCGLQPLVGYRYKCIQCPNYDLCQSCESEHRHPDHMMVRMPRNDCPRVVDAWVSNFGGTGGSRRRSGSGHHHQKRSKGQCPFVDATMASAAKEPEVNAETAEQQRHHHHGRKHHKRHIRNGIFTGFFDMMQDLAETGGVAATAAATAATAATETAAKAAEVATKVAVDVTKAATSPIMTATQKCQTEPNVANASTSTAKEPTQQQTSDNNGKSTDKSEPQKETPSMPTVNFDSLAQSVRPEYMRAGIEILNNFSEMFAKMLDPIDGAADDLPPKSANVSASTSTTSSGTTSDSETPEDADPASAAATSVNETQIPPAVATGTKPKTKETATAVTPEKIVTPTAPTPVKNNSRANSEEGDWLMIDDAQAISAAASVPVSDVNTPADSTQDSKTPELNFAQLSEDLRAHIAEEKALNEQQKQNVTNSETQTAKEVTVSTSIASTNTSELPPSPQPESRDLQTYHWNPRINNSVKIMMAMGFSNEGAWLTQLLENVDGDISAALDLMGNTQREANKSN